MSYSTIRRGYLDSYTRRHCDAGVRAVRHSDGLKEIGNKIKDLCKKLAAYFKSIGVGGAIARLLMLVLAGVGAVFTARKTTELMLNSNKLLRLAMELDAATEKQQKFILENGAKAKAAITQTKVVAKLSKALAERAAKKAAKAKDKAENESLTSSAL